MSKDQSLGKQISKQHFVALVKEAGSVRSELSQISGDFGERLKLAQDNSNLHLKAFRTICAMDRMEEQKRDAFWDCLQLYHDFAQAERWGGRHVGDLDKMARAGAGEDEGADGDDAGDGTLLSFPNGGSVTLGAEISPAESERNAAGIKELPVEKHEANQKGRRGRAKAAAEKAQTEDDLIEAAAERGRIDWADRKPGNIPDDLEGRPKEAKAWLDAWEAGQVASSKARDAADFDVVDTRKADAQAEPSGTYALN